MAEQERTRHLPRPQSATACSALQLHYVNESNEIDRKAAATIVSAVTLLTISRSNLQHPA
jgi:hypothetical protein